MKKPLLLVVTGTPSSGKTTLAHLLSKEIKCPLLSRDEFKEGYVNTMEISHSQMNDSVGMHIYESFFEAIELFISKKISIIIEAAFQEKLWKPKLTALSAHAEIKIIICKTIPELAIKRFNERLSKNPDRKKYHGDISIHSKKEEIALLIKNYKRIEMDVPILEVDTSEDYKPRLKEIIEFIQQKNNKFAK